MGPLREICAAVGVTPGNCFYGWPWYYMGNHPDPRHNGKHPELGDKVVVPDVLIQAHSGSLDLTFCHGERFPERYRNQIFAAEHGSWNREKRTGYKVILVPVQNGEATGEYEDFLTAFVTVRISIWRVTYVGGSGAFSAK